LHSDHARSQRFEVTFIWLRLCRLMEPGTLGIATAV
jgi:hypothetical protein